MNETRVGMMSIDALANELKMDLDISISLGEHPNTQTMDKYRVTQYILHGTGDRKELEVTANIYGMQLPIYRG